jgi:GNAT superfamily N-acetyltransferase
MPMMPVDVSLGPGTLRAVGIDHSAARSLLDGLAHEFRSYGELLDDELTAYEAAEFETPHGQFVLLHLSGRTVAGGGLRRVARRVAEVKRMWTDPAHRGRGFGRQILVELEAVAVARGYSRSGWRRASTRTPRSASTGAWDTARSTRTASTATARGAARSRSGCAGTSTRAAAPLPGRRGQQPGGARTPHSSRAAGTRSRLGPPWRRAGPVLDTVVLCGAMGPKIDHGTAIPFEEGHLVVALRPQTTTAAGFRGRACSPWLLP